MEISSQVTPNARKAAGIKDISRSSTSFWDRWVSSFALLRSSGLDVEKDPLHAPQNPDRRLFSVRTRCRPQARPKRVAGGFRG